MRTTNSAGTGHPTVAFVLQGGGSLAAGQVGMLRALFEAGIRPDLMVGSSAGALNAVAFAENPTTVVFGAGPIGLGATIWLKLRGVQHVVVADVIPSRLETALAVGADAVIDSSREDVTARLTELHGQDANALGQPRPGTDIYLEKVIVTFPSAETM